MRIVFFTGAGLSAESGIPTFHGAGGLYEGIPAEKWLTGTNYARELRAGEGTIDRFIDELRRKVFASEPNDAHRMIANVAKRYPDTVVFTQNVDDLLERAGAPENQVVHVHGSLFSMRCLNKRHTVRIGAERNESMRCPECGARMRADVVLFEEQAPHYRRMWKTFDSLASEDMLIAIGTQGLIIPIGEVARMSPAFSILNNLHRGDSIDPSGFNVVLHMPATIAAPRIDALIQDRQTA